MIYLFVIPLSILVLPWVITRYILVTQASAKVSYDTLFPYLASAALLWVTSFFLPNIPLTAETETFSQHATGGVVASILFFAAVRAYGWRFNQWWQLPVSLYFFVSGLGVANELFELLTTKTGLIIIDSSDVWWDLLANTVGAGIALAVATASRYYRVKP
jgi:hypothetical protein